MGEDLTPAEQGQDPPERETEQPTVHVGRRLTVSQAAEELGISAEAVRSRVKRGALHSTKDGGTVYVLLHDRQDDDQTRPGDDQPQTEHDQTSARTENQADLVESLLDQV
ncbi:MAG: helix-turn-helix domain-containing protein, partial [Actinobacteria bacterium]|nr:helix-turn-helix domain-containing protein [Actinomycetota bacterium]